MSEEKFRIESDLLGELQVPVDAYYGVQTQRAINNYKISNTKMCDYPEYVIAMACIKLAAAQTNKELGAMDAKIADAIVEACREIIDGKFHDAGWCRNISEHECERGDCEQGTRNHGTQEGRISVLLSE